MADRSTLVSVDLDDLACYHAIHGLPPPDPGLRGVVLERCLPRFLDLFAELSIRATFFVIGRDLDRDLRERGTGAQLLRDAVAAGHELANHSYAHAYDLVTWRRSSIASDVQACDLLLRDLGAEVRGFRAPGYTHDQHLLAEVRRIGYLYDSSLLPSPGYFAAKLAAIGVLAIRGRRSSSMVRGGRSFLGPRRPFRRLDVDLWELPVSVVGPLRIPLVGTALLSGPRRLRQTLRNGLERLEHAHVEFHGLDLADPDADGYDASLRARQPELRTALATKLAGIREALRSRGATTTLLEYVRRAEPTD